MCPHELPCHAVALVHIAEGVVAAEAVAVHDGFHQTAPKPVKVTGISGRAALDYMISTMRKGNMLRVNVLVDLLPTKARNAINIVIDLINTVVMALFFYGSITVIQNALNSGRTSPAMELPMAAVYICLLIGFGLGVLRGIQQIVLHVMNFNKKELTTLEQAMADAAEEAAAAKGDLEGGAN